MATSEIKVTKSCPAFDFIPDLVTYLIEKCIEVLPADEAAEKLNRVLCLEDYPHAYLDGEERGHFNERFDSILELAKIATNQF